MLHGSETHRRLLDWTYDLMVSINKHKIEDGEIDEDDFYRQLDEQMDSISKMPYEVFTIKLLQEIPLTSFYSA